MKHLFLSIVFFYFVFTSLGQTEIKMEKSNGVFLMPCKVNGLPLKFIFDTGASDVTISLTEALFMLKNGYLKEGDIFETEKYIMANGEIEEGTSIIIRELEIGGLTVFRIKASIVHNLKAPLLLGQTALSKFGKVDINYQNNTLIIHGEKTAAKQSTNTENDLPQKTENTDEQYLFSTQIVDEHSPANIRKSPEADSQVIYKCTNEAMVYVLEITNNSFIKVKVNGYTGYVLKRKLKRKWK